MSEFEWDPKKRDSNLRIHAIDFADVGEVFDDPNFIETEDRRHEYGEVRLQVIGELRGQIVFVVYTWRDQKRRLISARRAHPNERQEYQTSKGRA